MTTLVFPHGTGRDGTLMWSLRSIAAHYDPTTLDVIVAGHIPEWLDTRTATALPVRQAHNRSMLNVWNALAAVVQFIGDGPFVLMNDDFFATSVASLESTVNRGPAAAHIDAMGADLSRSLYRGRLKRTVGLLESEGLTAPASWETHTPLPLSGAAVRVAEAAMRHYNLVPGVVAQRTLMAELAGLRGPTVTDPKVYTHERVPIPAPWVSTCPLSWHGATGESIRGTYLTPSPWELADDYADGEPPTRPHVSRRPVQRAA